MSADNTNEVQHDERGFGITVANSGLHRDTGTHYDPEGYDQHGYNAEGFDSAGYDCEGWNAAGFHRETGTEFDRRGRSINGSFFNEAGYNRFGFDRDGYNREGYDEDGYDSEGEDSSGNTRCDNGQCRDSECPRCASFSDKLDDYGTRAPVRHGWRPKPGNDRTLYAGHEIEMFSDDEDYEDVEFVLGQIDREYARLHPQTRNGRCAIAKRDGSLDDTADGGFETVTVPLTAEQTYGIFSKFKTLGSGRCSAWNMGDDVGHHIHLSRAAIGPLTLGKLGVFMNCDENRGFLVAIAGRDAGFNSFEDGKKLTEPTNCDRYSVLNITDNTVEFRMFKSNLFSKAILKNYEFCIAAVRFCEQAAHGFGETETSSDPLHFINFRRYVAAARSTYPYLHEFMLAHPGIRTGYRRNSGLPASVANPKERSPKHALLHLVDVTGA